MNRRQKAIVLTAAGVAILMLAFPPFTLPAGQGRALNMGFSFIFSPPRYSDGIFASVDVALLSIELAVCAAVTVALVYLFKE
jgi:hypothetical protein